MRPGGIRRLAEPANSICSRGPKLGCPGRTDWQQRGTCQTTTLEPRLIAARFASAATYLVTGGHKLQRTRSAPVSLSARPLRALLVQFAPSEVPPPLGVANPATYTLRTDDSNFDGLPCDSQGFVAWFEEVRAESEMRSCYSSQREPRTER